MPAAISTAMAASMGDLKAALVGATGGAQSRGGGQFQQCAQQPSQPLQQQSNFSNISNHMGHVSLSNPHPLGQNVLNVRKYVTLRANAQEELGRDV